MRICVGLLNFQLPSELPFHLNFTMTCRICRGLIIINQRWWNRHVGVGGWSMNMQHGRGWAGIRVECLVYESCSYLQHIPVVWRVAEFATLKYVTLAYWFFGKSKCWGEAFFLNSHSSKDRASKRNSIVIHPLLFPKEFHLPGKICFITGKETRSQHQDKLYHKHSCLPSLLLRAYCLL